MGINGHLMVINGHFGPLSLRPAVSVTRFEYLIFLIPYQKKYGNSCKN